MRSTVFSLLFFGAVFSSAQEKSQDGSKEALAHDQIGRSAQGDQLERQPDLVQPFPSEFSDVDPRKAPKHAAVNTHGHGHGVGHSIHGGHGIPYGAGPYGGGYGGYGGGYGGYGGGYGAGHGGYGGGYGVPYVGGYGGGVHYPAGYGHSYGYGGYGRGGYGHGGYGGHHGGYGGHYGQRYPRRY